jgi:hypothetical protein
MLTAWSRFRPLAFLLGIPLAAIIGLSAPPTPGQTAPAAPPLGLSNPSQPISKSPTDSVPNGAGFRPDGGVPGPDSSAARSSKSRSDSVIVVKHSFNHREQIITGSVIMTCLILMMVTMNNYNPR